MTGTAILRGRWWKALVEESNHSYVVSLCATTHWEAWQEIGWPKGARSVSIWPASQRIPAWLVGGTP